MSYDVIYTNKSLKQLKKLSETVSESIISSIDELKNDPYCNIKKLKGIGKQPLYSHRVGEYRVILTIENNRMLIFIVEIGDRKTIYRKYQS